MNSEQLAHSLLFLSHKVFARFIVISLYRPPCQKTEHRLGHSASAIFLFFHLISVTQSLFINKKVGRGDKK